MITRHGILIKKYKQELKDKGYTTTHTSENRHKALLRFKKESERIIKILSVLIQYHINTNPRMSNIYHQDKLWFQRQNL